MKEFIKKHKNYFIFGVLAIVILFFCIFFDQFTKSLAINNLVEGESVPFMGDFIQWYLTFNQGAARSFGSGATWSRILLVIMSWAVALGIIGFAVYTIVKKKEFKLGLWTIILFVLGGDIGNLIDRTFFYERGVCDFISIQKWWPGFGIFNIADSILVVSIFALVIYFIVDAIKEYVSKKKKVDEKIKEIEKKDE